MILISILDVAILYQIITTAEQSSDIESLPFRAIFAAYDDVLAQNGLDPDHDQIYLRFLFRLGDKKLPDRSLYESFESLLEELGIQIEINSGEDGVREVTRDLSAENGAEYETGTQPDSGGRPRKNARRASFHSLHNIEDDITRASRSGAQSRASSSEFPPGRRPFSEERPATRASTRPTERTPQRQSRSQPPIRQLEGRRLTAQEFAGNLENSIGVDGMGNTFLHRDFLENTANHIRRANSMRQPMSTTANATNGENQVSTITNGIQPVYAVDQQALLYRPSETQQMRDVETFEYYRINAVTRNILRRWNLVAQQAKQHHIKMNIAAIKRDTGVLVRQGFDHWRMRIHVKKRAAETERFYYRLERRAVKARDLFLLTKAFTHWAESAYEQVLRTSMVRQHVLSLKYFNAWREITVVNEFKVRRQGLRKFFGIWKQRCVHNLIDEAATITHYHRSLRKRAYWRWFWTFYEKRAPEWRHTHLKEKFVKLWVLRSRDLSQQEQLVTSHKFVKTRAILFSLWLSKTRLIASRSEEAAVYNRQKLTARSVREWELSLRLRPLAQQISNAVDWKIAGATFATLVYRFRVERYAEEVNRRRIKRSAWTQWNDLLRCKTLAEQIDDRLLLETLYKWVLAERSTLLQRLNALRIKRKVFSKIVNQLQSIQVQRDRICQIAEHDLDRRNLRLAFKRWKLRLSSCRRDERTALMFYDPRIAQEALQVWNNKHTQIQRLNRWAKDARFYFLISKFIKRWCAAVAESKRMKRRDAYVQVRRRLKMSLARNAISRWQDLTSQLITLKNQSHDFNQARLLRLGTDLFDKWKTRCDFQVDRNQSIGEIYQQNLASRYFRPWLDQLRAYQEHQVRAQQFADLRVGRLAFEGLHKLRLQMIELQGRARKAESLRILHERRHHHNLLRTWFAKTASRRGLPPRETILSSRPKRFATRLEASEDTAASRAEEWTAFEDGFDLGDWIPALEAQTNATPLPGHLSTPSKRAARARRSALADHITTTTTTTPAGTPFRPIPNTLPPPRNPNPNPNPNLDPPHPPQQQQHQHPTFHTPGSQPRRRAGLGLGLGSGLGSGLGLGSSSRRGRPGVGGLRGSLFGAIVEDEPRTPGGGGGGKG